MMIETVLPGYDVAHVCETEVDATPAETYRALLDAEVRHPLATSWTWLVEDPGVELVMGAVGRFWRRDSGERVVSAEEFLRFNEPGHARLAVSLSVKPKDFDRSVLRYELHAAATDEEARRRLRRYWHVTEPVVGMAMVRALERIRADAEQMLVSAGA